MDLWEMSMAGALLILAVSVLRAALVNYLPKRAFLVLWGIVLLRLFVPVRIPSVLSVYSWAVRGEQSTGAGVSREWQDGVSLDFTSGSKGAAVRRIERRIARDIKDSAGFVRWPDVFKENILRAAWAAGCAACLAASAFAAHKAGRAGLYNGKSLSIAESRQGLSCWILAGE